MSVLDFDIEEKDEMEVSVESPTGRKLSPATTDTAGQERDTSFLSSLLRGPTPPKQHQQQQQQTCVVEAKSPSPPKESRSSAKKFPKLSQKERKRQSQAEAVESSPVASPTKAWSGWHVGGGGGPATPTAAADATPSLTDIMQMEDKQWSSGGGGNKERRVSESEAGVSGPLKKSSWKQLAWGKVEQEQQSPSPTKAAVNPWNTATKTPEAERSFADLMDAEVNSSFSKIMEQDVKVSFSRC